MSGLRLVLRWPVVALLLAACAPVETAPTLLEGGEREAVYRRAAQLRGQAFAAIDAADWATAVTALEELERVLPDNVLAPINLIVAHRQTGNTEDARAAAERASALAPDNPRLLYNLAELERAGGGDWQQALDRFATTHRRDPRPHYLRTRWLEADGQPMAAYASAEAAVALDPENLVLLIDRLVQAANGGLGVSVLDAIDAVEDRLGGFEASLSTYADEIRAGAELAGMVEPVEPVEGSEAADVSVAPQAQVLRNILRPTELYRQHLIPLIGKGGAESGFFLQLDFDPPLPKSIQGGSDIEVGFEPTGGAVAIRSPVVVDSLADHDRLLTIDPDGLHIVARKQGRWQRVPVAGAVGTSDRIWSRLDFDQDGEADLLLESASDLRLLADGETSSVSPLTAPLSGVFPVDFDHDGDLDLVLAWPDRASYLRNNGDGSWTVDDTPLGELSGAGITDLASADFDDDGDLDLIATSGGEPSLLGNLRRNVLRDDSEAAGLRMLDGSFSGLAVEDFDADGQFDLLAWGSAWGSGGAGWLANRSGRFEFQALPAAVDAPWLDAATADFDNDGDRDAIAVVAGGAAWLLRNLGGSFEAVELGIAAPEVRQLVPGDFDGDGDLDLAVASVHELRHWRNEGGSLNHWLRLRLRGKSENNSKNNSQGLFVRIESRVGSDYQALQGNGGVNHIGLGAARQVDALRVVWTNGLAQSWAALAADQALDEEQVLKGSCPFLYTWTGDRFEFVTDLMWKSPLGMVFADGSAAPHQSARDFVLIPGEVLKPVAGEYWLQVTEELWETVYVDEQRLMAIDHPESAELVVNERFTLPPHPREPELHWIDRRLRPTWARDAFGRDVSHELSARDASYVGALPLSRYQGVAAPHSLNFAFDAVPSGEPARLVLWGWIFPTDTSINVALSQGSGPKPAPPRLELRDANGEWQLLEPSISIPNGKRKAIVVDLGHRLPAGSVELRLVTSMQIYWDSALLALGSPPVEPVVTTLVPRTAELHYRGFSRLDRRSESSPHLFDYSRVDVAPRFRDLEGRYTRFGSIDDLLIAADDRYVVMNAGDELTVRFPAAELPELAPGWRRDFVLYTDGWVKDGDINTAASQSVEPLPYHAMSAYPAPTHTFPSTPKHRQWLADYQTREVDAAAFRSALRASRQEPRP